jgi:DNA/RNA endonuclease YhcR with UshA esterase domain
MIGHITENKEICMNRFIKALTIFLVLSSPITAISAGEKANVEKAPADKVYKVSELFKEKAGLNNQKVTVKGKVVKVSAGIMNRNWMHLQDGSGDPAKGTNDLTITTSGELPAMGKVVTVSGTLRKDKDFGSGYFYQIIIEDGVIKP